MPRPFRGVVNLDFRDSVQDWDAFREEPAREGSPNVLIVLYDDTGLAAWSPFGGRIEMPTLQRLADNGLTYSQWHTTALCSPTRSCFLTGRNHHQNGFAQIAEGATGFPGLQRPHPAGERGTLAEVMREARLEHVLARQEPQRPGRRLDDGRTKANWPLAQGSTASTASSAARRTSGIPTWPRTTTTSTSPTCRRRATTSRRTSPTRRSRLSATRSSRTPTSRWFMWFCPGANHAPHHSPAGLHRQVQGRRSTTATRPTANGCCRG